MLCNHLELPAIHTQELVQEVDTLHPSTRIPHSNQYRINGIVVYTVFPYTLYYNRCQLKSKHEELLDSEDTWLSFCITNRGTHDNVNFHTGYTEPINKRVNGDSSSC